MTYVYTPNEPKPTETLAQSQPLLNANMQYLNASLNVDHNMTLTNPNTADGYHKVIRYVNQSSFPGNVSGTGQLFTKTPSGGTNQELFYISGTSNNIIQLTQSNTAVGNAFVGTNGTIWIPGPLLMQWGTVNGSTGTVTFATSNKAFPNQCFGVFGSVSGSGSTSTLYVAFNNVSKTSFGFVVGGAPAPPAVDIFWVAIGG